MMDYSKNIQKMFALGTEGLEKDTIDYQELGLESSDTQELILVALDDTLHYNDMVDTSYLYTPVHAIKALTQLKSIEAFESIATLVSKHEDDDYIADAVVSYAQVLDKVDSIKSMITNNSLSNLASDTLYKALNKDELQAEAEAKAKAEEEAKLQAEVEAKAKAEEEAKLQAEAEAKAKVEEEARLQAEAEAKAKAEEEAKLQAEVEAKAKAEEEAKLQAEVEAKAKAEEEARLQAEAEAKAKAEEEAKLQAEVEAKAKEEEEAKLQAEVEAEVPTSITQKIESVTVTNEPKAQSTLDPHIKVGRNDPCPCGSGNKYKKCCMNK